MEKEVKEELFNDDYARVFANAAERLMISIPPSVEDFHSEQATGISSILPNTVLSQLAKLATNANPQAFQVSKISFMQVEPDYVLSFYSMVNGLAICTEYKLEDGGFTREQYLPGPDSALAELIKLVDSDDDRRTISDGLKSVKQISEMEAQCATTPAEDPTAFGASISFVQMLTE